MRKRQGRRHSRRDFFRIAGASAIAAEALPPSLLSAVGGQGATATVGIARSFSVRQAIIESLELPKS